MSAPRTLVWDLGGVVLRWEPAALVREAMAHLVPDDDEGAERLADLIFEEFVPDGDWSQFDRGTITEEELAARMAARAGVTVADVEGLLAAVPGHLQPVAAVVALVRDVRSAGHRVVYLSNMPAPLAANLDADPQFAGWFSGGVYSCRVGAVKPEPAIFQAAERLLDLAPGLTTLVDDRMVNLEQAGVRGWSTVHYVGVEQARGELARAGWLEP